MEVQPLNTESYSQTVLQIAMFRERFKNIANVKVPEHFGFIEDLHKRFELGERNTFMFPAESSKLHTMFHSYFKDEEDGR